MGGKLIFIGSSVCWGYGAQDHHGWSFYLGKDYEAQGWQVSNCSIGGQTTTDILLRLERDVIVHHPEVCIVGLGLANEGLPSAENITDGRVIQGIFEHNLLSIKNALQQAGISVLLGGVYPNNRYNAMRLATDKSDELGFAVQVWKPGNETAAAKRFTDLFSQSFGGQKIKNVATDAFISTHHKLNELCFFEKSKKATVLISCTESVCSSEQLKSVAQIIQRRL